MKPKYLLSVDEAPPEAITLIVRTTDAGTTGQLALPQWQELPAAFDGPHEIGVAIHLADSYAEAYGYSAVVVDIESSQLWREEWGPLGRASEEP